MCAKTDILTTLAYYDLFCYPLTQTEIFFFLHNQHEQDTFQLALQRLVSDGVVFKLDEFYLLQNDYSLITRRRKGNLAARKLLDKAEHIASFLSAFPFVRGVAVSGSLSKNYADEKSDIDFFIVTKQNRLWIARTIMHLFKKLTFLFKKEHFFCMNYYVDEAGLQIKEKNIYTATELATLLPLRGIEGFRKFYQENGWSRSYLPNHAMKIAYTKEVRTTILKNFVEWSFSNPLGTVLDALLMRVTIGKWKKKTAQRRLNANGNLMSMDGSKHYAKPDPISFQKRLLTSYNLKLIGLLERYQRKLKPVS